ncbi:hypothetical protein BXZ70DRAFT_1075337 [Cristinia sonorae]|uniref:Short-chain dehydrogenase/reductase n=1 Tax=Cristinia sonorae TaxID=1940300 RepID=A0A8K0XT74_9AGAR|nr:hypothetical protein BXZ70DRAFT_1075337 [Cristinia sonorae]
MSRKTALITGFVLAYEGGAGFAMAVELHRQGIRVFATARSLESMTKLRDLGIEILQMDVTVPSTVQSVRAAIEQLTGGTLDILVNNAGMSTSPPPHPLSHLTDNPQVYEAAAIEDTTEQAKALFAVNLFGVMEVTQAFAPLLVASSRNHIAQKTGFYPRVIQIGSQAAVVPVPFYSAYHASKAALSMYGNVLRIEMESFGVKVVTVLMGRVTTKIVRERKNLPEGSLYTPIKDLYEGTIQEIFPSDNQMSTEVFAKRLIPKILTKKPSAFIWIAGNPWTAWALDTFFPRAWDSFFKRFVRLDKVGEAFRKEIAGKSS